MVALIFGVAGQDGFYLERLLEEKGIIVHGVSRSKGTWLQGDVGDQSFLEGLIKDLQPDYIFHLAANSTTRHAAALENHKSIESGTLFILEACYQYSRQTKIFLSGSAVQFANDGKPINEQTAFAPLSAYAVSRISSTYMGRYYRSLGLQVYIGFFFNHDSPLRTNRHVNQAVISTVKRIASGSNEKLKIGDLDTMKEFNFAGDITQAVWVLVNQNNYYEAVLGSGKAYSIKDWINICFDLAGLNWKNYTVERPGFKAEYAQLVSDPSRIFSLGWKPVVGIEQLAKMMFNDTTN